MEMDTGVDMLLVERWVAGMLGRLMLGGIEAMLLRGVFWVLRGIWTGTAEVERRDVWGNWIVAGAVGWLRGIWTGVSNKVGVMMGCEAGFCFETWGGNVFGGGVVMGCSWIMSSTSLSIL